MNRPTGPGSCAAPPRASFTLVELLASSVILSILAVTAVPFAESQRNRQTEIELKEALIKVRRAIWLYAYNEPDGSPEAPASKDADRIWGEDPAGDPDMDGILDDDLDGQVDEDGAPFFPPDLDDLIKRKYLPGLPADPLGLGATPTTTEAVIATWELLEVTRVLGKDPLGQPVETKGIYDVRSRVHKPSLAGDFYDGW